MSLVNGLNETPNVHIVLSCRRFDFEYDSRFTGLNAKEVELGDLLWPDVEMVLQGEGLDPSSWSEPARKVICTPQHLRLFVDHFSGSGGAPTFDSYHSMLETVFSLRLRGTGSRSLRETLGSVALEMAEQEELWQPRARFDSKDEDIEKLIGRGFLLSSDDEKRVTFRHQTVFDFVRARAFVSSKHKLAEFVAAKHDSLHIRPILWSALHYLRSADPRTYREQLKQIWEIPNLRIHVRLLLISFLGRLSKPNNLEAKLLLSAVDDERFCKVILSAVSVVI